jgi:hypothetical protein
MQQGNNGATASGRYPIQFQIDTDSVPEEAWLTRKESRHGKSVV